MLSELLEKQQNGGNQYNLNVPGIGEYTETLL
jgi:hypothetical protein